MVKKKKFVLLLPNLLASRSWLHYFRRIAPFSMRTYCEIDQRTGLPLLYRSNESRTFLKDISLCRVNTRYNNSLGRLIVARSHQSSKNRGFSDISCHYTSATSKRKFIKLYDVSIVRCIYTV